MGCLFVLFFFLSTRGFMIQVFQSWTLKSLVSDDWLLVFWGQTWRALLFLESLHLSGNQFMNNEFNFLLTLSLPHTPVTLHVEIECFLVWVGWLKPKPCDGENPLGLLTLFLRLQQCLWESFEWEHPNVEASISVCSSTDSLDHAGLFKTCVWFHWNAEEEKERQHALQPLGIKICTGSLQFRLLCF